VKSILITTKALTVKSFLIPLILRHIENQDELTIVCNNAFSLSSQLPKSKYIRLIDPKFPEKWKDLVNPVKILLTIIRVRKIISENKEALIHVHTPIAAHLVRLSKAFSKNILIYHVHGFRFHDGNSFVQNLPFFILEVALSWFTSHYIVINKDDYNFVKKVLKKNVHFVPGVGIDVNKIDLIRKRNIATNPLVVIGVVGAYKKAKGYSDIISVARHFEDSGLIFIECFGYGDHKYFEKNTSDNVYDNIRFNEFSDEILMEMRKFDLFIHPSRREGLPVSVMESMCLGIPIVATNIRGCRDLIEDRVSGRLYLPGDVDSLVHIIKDFISNREKYKLYAKRATRKCSESYDSELIAQEIYRVLSIIYLDKLQVNAVG
jgi:glycosyltransferase involved in cell wall biosynthesis